MLKKPSHSDGSFEYPQHMFWLKNKFFAKHSYLKACQAKARKSTLARDVVVVSTHETGKEYTRGFIPTRYIRIVLTS